MPRQHSTANRESPPSGQETLCPVFASLIETLAARDGPAILELGPASAEQLELLGQFGSKLYIEDAHELVADLREDAAADGAALRHWLAQWTAAEPASVDVVFAWDLFNYLPAPLWPGLMNYLTPLLRPRGLLYMMVYSQREMPALPQRFKAMGPDRLAYRPQSEALRGSPRFSQMEIKRRLRAYSVVKSVLLRSGMQEYLLRRES